MVELVHENTSLRFFNVSDGEHTTLRTFSGVRRGVRQDQVRLMMDGINMLVTMPATNATMTTRAVMVKG